MLNLAVATFPTSTFFCVPRIFLLRVCVRSIYSIACSLSPSLTHSLIPYSFLGAFLSLALFICFDSFSNLKKVSEWLFFLFLPIDGCCFMFGIFRHSERFWLHFPFALTLHIRTGQMCAYWGEYNQIKKKQSPNNNENNKNSCENYSAVNSTQTLRTKRDLSLCSLNRMTKR